MPGPLLAVDAPSLLYRAFYALPKTITDGDGHAGQRAARHANLVLQAVERHAPRAVVLCFGEEAAHYRVELYPTYHADRIDMPRRARAPVAATRRPSSAPSTGPCMRHDTLEADDLLGGARTGRGRGRRAGAALHRRPRHVPVRLRRRSPSCGRRARARPSRSGPAEVRARYGVRPEQVPDFIALRGDPSDGLPGAKGIGEKTARELLTEHGTLEALLALPMSAAPAGAPVR